MAFWLSKARSPNLFPWAVTRFRFQPAWGLAHQLPSQIPMLNSEPALLQHPAQCRNDMRPFAIVVNTALDEFLFIGANGDPVFAIDSGPGKVFVSSRDEWRYENGKWIAGRRLNGDELFQSSLPKTKVGM